MLNIIWPVFLIIAFIYAIISGRVAEVFLENYEREMQTTRGVVTANIIFCNLHCTHLVHSQEEEIPPNLRLSG